MRSVFQTRTVTENADAKIIANYDVGNKTLVYIFSRRKICT